MKRILIVISILCAMPVAMNAQQVKSIASAKSAAEKAQTAAENPKQNTKAQTWVKLGQTMIDAYLSPMGNGWIGATPKDLEIVMNGEQPTSVENVTLTDGIYTRQSYATSDYYFNQSGWLQMIIVTKPIFPDVLDRALGAFSKAGELDVKKAKSKDIINGLKTLNTKFTEEAYNAYSFGDIKTASACFEKAAIARETAPLSIIDTNAVFNAGFTAYVANDLDRAKAFLQRSVELGYYGEEGDAYVKLSEIVKNQGDTTQCQAYLEEAFQKFPQSQGVLIGLINFYMDGEGNASRLFELLDAAKENEPGNASLYYVEGNIHSELGEIEQAVASYEKCAEINPEYEYGFIGEGQMFYNLAVKIQEEANAEEDYKAWKALDAKFAETLKACIEPFEKSFVLTKNDEVRAVIAEYLKNATFRFRDESQEYADKYEIYDKYVKENKKD
ncbi:MAG: hypothetical protein MJY43_02935 [Bacteroidales bacterium]|nr:hypothetical protein [Bacteroidales bacterium]